MSRPVLIRWGACVVLVATAQIAVAQDDLIGELYGRGVHAFYSRDFEEAHKQLTASIEQGSRDPRCFYFRGLAYARLGRPEESAADIKQGAALELANTEQLHGVSVALQRVQGTERITIEKERVSARLEASKKAKALRLRRSAEGRSDHRDRPCRSARPPRRATSSCRAAGPG